MEQEQLVVVFTRNASWFIVVIQVFSDVFS